PEAAAGPFQTGLPSTWFLLPVIFRLNHKTYFSRTLTSLMLEFTYIKDIELPAIQASIIRCFQKIPDIRQNPE
ncbi:MAG TPA: hypothetical protein O0X35_05675, partial [Methanocorpusculum sp.]|nr:hypothetical protein [Methanocorpusculum sp.]